MHVHNTNKITRIYNVIGTIRGSVEPGESLKFLKMFCFYKDKFQSAIERFLADLKL
jgi:hypothetical protein